MNISDRLICSGGDPLVAPWWPITTSPVVSTGAALVGRRRFALSSVPQTEQVLDLPSSSIYFELPTPTIFSRIKFIVSTAGVDEEEIEDARDAGAAEVLVKPYSREELLAVIDRVSPT